MVSSAYDGSLLPWRPETDSRDLRWGYSIMATGTARETASNLTNECLDYFASLGHETNARWRALNYDESRFPELSSELIERWRPCDKVGFMDAVRLGCLCSQLPQQTDLDASFGQPPVTVYWQHEFRIELLFWSEGLPAIHQHGFSGAFHVMSGSSLHSIWEFEEELRVSLHLLFGQMTFVNAKVLSQGATHPIRAGRRFIHTTYHLEKPTVTLVLRTNSEEPNLPQYSYLPPSIAFAQPIQPPSVIRRRQLLSMLKVVGRVENMVAVAEEAIESTETYSAVECLRDVYRLTNDLDQRRRVAAVAQGRLGELFQPTMAVLAEQERRDRISLLKRAVNDPEVQFFLALLLNVPERDVILQLLSQRRAEITPCDQICQSIRKLLQLQGSRLKLPFDACDSIRAELDGANARQSKNVVSPASRMHWFLAPLFNDTTVRPPTSKDLANEFQVS